MQKMGNTKPVIIAFRQEMDVMARVIKTVRSTLKNLKLAMDGTIVMSDDLANALDSMFNAKVPALWLKGNWFSPTVGMWFGISKYLQPLSPRQMHCLPLYYEIFGFRMSRPEFRLLA